MSILIFFIVLSVLVLIHELGHFLAAKKSGVLVEEFGLGLPPRAIGKKIGNTIYSLNWLPFGGFVKVYGEEAAELAENTAPKSLQSQAFTNKKPTVRLFILTAGVLMNIILAVGIFYILLSARSFVSDPLVRFSDHHFRFGREKKAVLITSIGTHTPAAKTSLVPGDVITYVRQETGQWTEPQSMEDLIRETNRTQGKPLLLTTKNVFNDRAKEVLVTPVFDKTLNRMIIGVGLTDAVTLDYNDNKILSGLYHSYNMVSYHVSVLGTLTQSSVKEKNIGEVTRAVSGPIGILAIVDDIVKNSGPKLMINLLNLVATLSLSLAVINILPFPALDGGRVAFVLYEWVRGKKMSPKLEQKLNLAGFAFLLSLIALITLNDLIRIFVK